MWELRHPPNGNRLSHTTLAGTLTATYDDQDRMLTYGDANYLYTRNGELSAKIVGTDTTKYTYDHFGNLVKVVLPTGDVIDCLIDGQNRRIGRKLNGVVTNSWLYSGQLTPVAELDSAGNIVSRFVGNYMVKNDTTYRIITDHLGSPRLIVDIASGAVVERMDYDEFGIRTNDANPDLTPFGFAGGFSDRETQLTRCGGKGL